MVRTAQQWSELLAGKSTDDAARFILGDLTHYRHGGVFEYDDVKQLSNALWGFAIVLHQCNALDK